MWPSSSSLVKLSHLPGDVGLQLVEDGRASAVHLGLQVAPEAEVEEGEVGRSRRLLPTFDQILRNNKVHSPSFRVNIK